MNRQNDCRTEHDEALLLGVFHSLSRRLGVNVWILRVVAFLIACKIGFVPAGVLYLLAAILVPAV